MSDPGPAQLELIRRYARTLREMHADAMRVRRVPSAPGRSPVPRRRPQTAATPIRQAAKAMTPRAS